MNDPACVNEDVRLSIVLRKQLEAHGMAFPRTERAHHFSAEYMHPCVHWA